jgi:hypothetical protein
VDDSHRQPRIAVIAVHGVADQQPRQSADAIAALLLNLKNGEHAVYEPFHSECIHIPLSAPLRRESAGKAQGDFATVPSQSRYNRVVDAFEESEPGLRDKLVAAEPDYAVDDGGSENSGGRELREDKKKPRNSTAPAGASNEDDTDAGLMVMRSMLAFYESPEDERWYSTYRLRGRRTAQSQPRAGPVCEVDVYEMYWADLSRLGKDALRFFGSIYQILLHLSDLGRRALEDGLVEFSARRSWHRLLRAQAVAVRQLEIFIPLLNLILLLTMLCTVVVRLPSGPITGLKSMAMLTNSTGLRLTAVAGMMLLTAGVCYRSASTKKTLNYFVWCLIPIGGIALGAILGLALVTAGNRPDIVLFFECWIVGYVLLKLLMEKYERVRPGAVGSFKFGYGLATALYIWALLVALGQNVGSREIEYASLWTLQMMDVFLTVSWGVLIASALYAAFSGRRFLRRLEKENARSGSADYEAAHARARAAIRTSRLALAISASGLLALIILVWSGILAWGISSASAFDCMHATAFPPLARAEWLIAHPETLTGWLHLPVQATGCAGVEYSTEGYMRAVLLLGTTTGFPVGQLLVALAILLLVWMALPSIRYEGRSPSSCTNADSKTAGEWLSRGLDSTKLVGYLWWTAVFVVLVVFFFGDLGMRYGWYDRVPQLKSIFGFTARLAFSILNRAGTLVATSAAVIFFGAVKLGGSALDVILDVENYLRQRPRDSTPRARIAERYVSLLRYIAAQRDAAGRAAYDGVVIVAHSLGALITCDLLRLLHAEVRAKRADPSLAPFQDGASAPVPIHLFTMGNPLRQLLNRFFPHQYLWVREVPDNTLRRAENVVRSDSLRSHPAPDRLGVATWSNAYRSGDYVGRGIWLDDWYNRTKTGSGGHPEPIYVERSRAQAEMCIGLGAHTHYWDQSAPDIANHLDELIARAASGVRDLLVAAVDVPPDVGVFPRPITGATVAEDHH